MSTVFVTVAKVAGKALPIIYAAYKVYKETKQKLKSNECRKEVLKYEH